MRQQQVTLGHVDLCKKVHGDIMMRHEVVGYTIWRARRWLFRCAIRVPRYQGRQRAQQIVAKAAGLSTTISYRRLNRG